MWVQLQASRAPTLVPISLSAVCRTIETNAGGLNEYQKRSSSRDFKLSSSWVGVSPFLSSLEGLRITCSLLGLLWWTDLLTDFSFSFPLVTLFPLPKISQSFVTTTPPYLS